MSDIDAPRNVQRATQQIMRANLHKLLSLTLILALSATALAQRRNHASFDVIIRGGTVSDGSGRPPRRADVGLKGDRIAAIGNFSRATATTVEDANGLAVA